MFFSTVCRFCEMPQLLHDLHAAVQGDGAERVTLESLAPVPIAAQHCGRTEGGASHIGHQVGPGLPLCHPLITRLAAEQAGADRAAARFPPLRRPGRVASKGGLYLLNTGVEVASVIEAGVKNGCRFGQRLGLRLRPGSGELSGWGGEGRTQGWE